MSSYLHSKPGGYLMIASGIIFFATGAFAHQVAFYGIGAAFLAIGASKIRKTKQFSSDKS